MSLIKALVAPSISIDESGQSTRIVRKGMFVIVIMLGGFLLWAAWAPLSGAVISDGKVKIASNRKTLQHLEGGIVKDILVKDGDEVRQGQTLLLLEDTKTSADVAILRDQHDALLAKEARLHAERTLSSRINYPEELTKPISDKRRELIARESALFKSRRRMLDDQISLLQAELGHSKESIVSLEDQLKAIEENIRYKQEQVAMRENLHAKNFVGRADVLNQKQTLTDKKELLGERSAELNSTRARLSDLQLRIIDTKNKYIQEADNELKETSRQLAEIGERLRPAEDVMSRRTIAAPIAGQVMALKVTTIGGVITPGQAILDLVPKSDDLVIEVRVRNTDIDNVHVGQAAEVQLNAYNQRTTPLVKGSVVYLAGDVLENPQTGESYYPAHVRIDADALKLLENVKVEPGMPATAFIRTHEKTMLEYLVSPITQRMRHSFRED